MKEYLKTVFGKLLKVSDPSYVLKGSFWLSLAPLVNYIATIGSAVIFARLVEPTTYGDYSYILSWFAFFTIFSLPGMDTAIVQSVARGYEESFYSGFKIKFLWSLGNSLGLIITAVYFHFNGLDQLTIPLLLGAVFTPFLYASQIQASYLGGIKRFDLQTIATIFIQLSSYGFTTLTIFFTKDLNILTLVYFLSNAIPTLILYFLTYYYLKPNKKVDEHTIRYGKDLSFLQGLNIITSNIDRFMVYGLLGAADLALYSFALRPIMQISASLQNFSGLLLPKFAQKNFAELNLSLKTRIWQLTFAGVFLSGAYIFTAPFLYKYLFPQYEQAVAYSQLFALSLILQTLGIFISSLFRSQRLSKDLYISGISTQVLLLVLTLVMGYYWHIWGVIGAKLVAGLFSLGLSLYLWGRIQEK